MASGLKIVWILLLLRRVVLKQRNSYQRMAMLAEYAPILFHAVVLRRLKIAASEARVIRTGTNTIVFSLGVKKPRRPGHPTKYPGKALSMFEANRRAELDILARELTHTIENKCRHAS